MGFCKAEFVQILSLKPLGSCACRSLPRVMVRVSANVLTDAPCCRPTVVQGDDSPCSVLQINVFWTEFTCTLPVNNCSSGINCGIIAYSDKDVANTSMLIIIAIGVTDIKLIINDFLHTGLLQGLFQSLCEYQTRSIFFSWMCYM